MKPSEQIRLSVSPPLAPLLAIPFLLLYRLTGIGFYEVYLNLEGRARVLCFRSIGEEKALAVAEQLAQATGTRIG